MRLHTGSLHTNNTFGVIKAETGNFHCIGTGHSRLTTGAEEGKGTNIMITNYSLDRFVRYSTSHRRDRGSSEEKERDSVWWSNQMRRHSHAFVMMKIVAERAYL